MNKMQEAYNKMYSGYGDVNVGDLPILFNDDIDNIFFWMHLNHLRTAGKIVPKKIRRKMKPEEWAKIKRNIEIIAHQSRYALAYLNKMDIG